MEVWQISNLRPLRIGEEKKKKKKDRNHSCKYNVRISATPGGNN